MASEENKQTQPVTVTDKATGVSRVLQVPAAGRRSAEAQASADRPGMSSGVRGERELVPASEAARVAAAEGDEEKAGKPKKPEIEDVSDFIEAFYAGRAKVLGDKLRKRLTGAAAQINPERRAGLLASAVEGDPALEKSRQLLLVSLGLNAYSGLPRTLRDFARSALVLHPAMARRDADAWFPRSGSAGSSPRSLWEEIQLELAARAAAEAAQSDGAVPTAASASAAATRKALQNVFMSALIWRHAENDARLGETLRDLRATALAANPGASVIERQVLQFVVTLPDKEWSGLGALCRWFAEQTGSVQTQLQQASDALASQSDRIRGLSSDLEEATAHQDRLAGELEQAKQRIVALEEQARVTGVHAQADIDALRGRVFRVLQDELPLLQDALIALERDPPRVAPATEYLRAALDKLGAAVKIVENK